jgi:hypothetical protein
MGNQDIPMSKMYEVSSHTLSFSQTLTHGAYDEVLERLKKRMKMGSRKCGYCIIAPSSV